MNPIRAISACIAITLAVALGQFVGSGCTTAQQQTTYNSLFTVEHTVVSTYDGYLDLVIKGSVSTNGLPSVSKSYNTFQGAYLVALDAAQFNTNALAPANLITEAGDFVNLVNVIKKDIK
jgi:hypothetical protein